MIRRGLPFSEWPDEDRNGWTAATSNGDRFHRGPAAHWAPTTRAAVVAAYGRWIGHLAEAEPSALSERAVERLTEDRLVRYLAHLAETAGSMGQHMYFEKLRQAVRAMFPGRVPEHLTLATARLASERRARSKAERVVATPRLVALGLKLMKAALKPDGNIEDPVGYRDGLMIAVLACRPMRRRSYSLVTVGTHLQRIGKEWYMLFDGSEVKSGRGFRTTVPKRIIPFLESYLLEVRPLFTGADRHDGLWPSWTCRRPLTGNALARIISDRTRAEFGHAVYPHLFRHCAATTIATLDPGRIGVARDLLEHVSLSTTDTYYNMAGSIHANRVYAKVMAGLMSDARGRSHRSMKGCVQCATAPAPNIKSLKPG